MLGLSDVTRTSIVRSLTARELPLAVERYTVYYRFNSGSFPGICMPPLHIIILYTLGESVHGGGGQMGGGDFEN